MENNDNTEYAKHWKQTSSNITEIAWLGQGRCLKMRWRPFWYRQNMKSRFPNHLSNALNARLAFIWGLSLSRPTNVFFLFLQTTSIPQELWSTCQYKHKVIFNDELMKNYSDIIKLNLNDVFTVFSTQPLLKCCFIWFMLHLFLHFTVQQEIFHLFKILDKTLRNDDLLLKREFLFQFCWLHFSSLCWKQEKTKTNST